MRNVNVQGVARIIREYHALLYCCNGYFSAERNLRLYDNTTHKNRVLEIGQCPKCKALKVQIKQYRISDGKYCERKPKKSKDVAKFIRKFEKEAYYEIPDLRVKNGSLSNMGWRYVDASKSLWVKDFNNVRQFKLSKEYKVIG